MSDPIVSHVANQAYRDHVDEMTCKADGCKRWKVDGSEYCSDHGLNAWIPKGAKPPSIAAGIMKRRPYAKERG